ncbi:hypothetical protein CDD83_2779 [Cordyceps sp. RAO-2017]|nr:hypothetical protein CDD83_2779 [Cordyceps sp. RAO-2017]
MQCRSAKRRRHCKRKAKKMRKKKKKKATGKASGQHVAAARKALPASAVVCERYTAHVRATQARRLATLNKYISQHWPESVRDTIQAGTSVVASEAPTPPPDACSLVRRYLLASPPVSVRSQAPRSRKGGKCIVSNPRPAPPPSPCRPYLVPSLCLSFSLSLSACLSLSVVVSAPESRDVAAQIARRPWLRPSPLALSVSRWPR